ncbi:cell division control protein 6 [Metschnikowia aff. pulcherrima]|uniref:Cell division control protein n=1 Tax=Metschnikowia aff. pulcherrima TaxID=2163413 RepID=A0A4P6XTC1_9ASCO|nr:cell division control protein 6 [Metschnikowia aff. pulcherrima]
MLSPTKRTLDHDLPLPKRKALRPRENTLLTPESSPVKSAIVDISSRIKGHARRLNFSQDSIYSKAKSLFQRGARNPDLTSLVGREKEASILNQFLETSLKTKVCNSIYISGPPGTGKTAQTNLLLDYLCKNSDGKIHDIHGTKTQVLRINCMTISKPEDIFHELHTSLAGKCPGRKRTFDNLYELLSSKSERESLVVVLDEMDYLITKDQQVLFQLFHCASHLKSTVLQTKLIIVGISNALDLTDKFLPRLRSNGFNPEALQFMPYTADQIKQVVTSKLRSLVDQDKENQGTATLLMHPVAIQMCCKKCATVTGDLRKAFDICYKSIELVEQQAKQREDFHELTLSNAPKVLISHVAKVCTSTFGDSSQQKIMNLNLLQKAVLCCLHNAERISNSTSPLSVNGLYDYYCTHTLPVVEDLLGKIKKGEFLDIISALESALTITLATPRASSGVMDCGNKRILPNVSYADMLKCSEEVGILRKILLA